MTIMSTNHLATVKHGKCIGISGRKCIGIIIMLYNLGQTIKHTESIHHTSSNKVSDKAVKCTQFEVNRLAHITAKLSI